MTPSKHQALTEGLALIFDGISRLHSAFPNRHFTIDGRLVGDIGEVIAELEYDIKIHDVSQPDYDGTTSDGRRVQIKATFKNSLTFKSTPDYFLGFKLHANGTYEEIFNGPGKLIYDRYQKRKGLGTSLLSFPNTVLSELAKTVPPSDRIERRRDLSCVADFASPIWP
ncbi:hypothetical protein ISN76_11225 [Dyella halodurans]|uniref:DUF6998 domain-containing protein n=1 Tax=Dyella halodurans TaxID=1920171 RepID=A0ABV9C2M4_9GAMM|nr:hypothetical protein [Dyella halodurans]